MEIKRKRMIKISQWIAKASITIFVVYFIYSNIYIADLPKIFQSINPIYLPAPFLLYLISKYFTAERFRFFYNEIAPKINFNINIKLYLLGMYYNLFLPGGISGDALKIYYLNKNYNTQYNQLIVLSLIDRISGVVALLSIGIVAVPFVFTSFSIVLSILAVLILYIVFYESLKIIFSTKIKFNVFIITSIQSIAGQIVQILAVLILTHLLGIKENQLSYILIFLISSIVSIVPLTIGGIGAREFTFILGAQYLNLEANLAFSISFVFYLLTVVSSLSGIYFSLFPEKIFPQDFKIADISEGKAIPTN